jgi:hypothetical protein
VASACSISDPENGTCIDSEAGTVGEPDRILAGKSSGVGAPVSKRRKWTDEAYILLLMEVSERKVHVSVFGKIMDTFSDIAEALKFP